MIFVYEKNYHSKEKNINSKDFKTRIKTRNPIEQKRLTIFVIFYKFDNDMIQSCPLLICSK